MGASLSWARAHTLDDFHTLQLDEFDRFVCLESSGIVIPIEAESSDDEEEGEGSDEDEVKMKTTKECETQDEKRRRGERQG
ncbi:hypothetical protein JVU11DRAFT_11852 [Chiua virens]|nr:hypothetical protein JVU11DRAFT_11852 [Chiua virens]